MDYYKILNVKEDATLKEIEQSYQDLSSFYNPSNNTSKEAYRRYREINKAYLVLKENKQREMYNLIYNKKEEEVVKVNANMHSFNEFLKEFKEQEDINKFKDIVVEDEYDSYLKINLAIPYLYYLVNSEYLVSFNKEVIANQDGVCPVCLGLGKVKKNDKIVYCKSCLGSGKNIVTKTIQVNKYYLVNERIIDKDNNAIINFDYLDKENYIINGNVINVTYYVSKDEYYNGVCFNFKNKDDVLNIKEIDFSDTKKSYVFQDKIININYVLKDYENEVKKGYIVSKSEIVYLNPKDFTFNETSSDIYTLKLELNKSEVQFSLSNKDYLIKVIKLDNDNDKKIIFDKKIKKVSFNLFRFKGSYNNHYFKKKYFEYDDNYLYIPSRAYKLKNKYYTLFRVIYLSLILLVPLILFLIFNISHVFFISSFIFILVYLLGVNLLMEVKV